MHLIALTEPDGIWPQALQQVQNNNMLINLINNTKRNLSSFHIPNSCLRRDPDIFAALSWKIHSPGMSQNPCYFFPITHKKIFFLHWQKRHLCGILQKKTCGEKRKEGVLYNVQESDALKKYFEKMTIFWLQYILLYLN